MSEKEIRNALKKEKVVIGSKTVIRDMKNKKLETVFYAKNCPEGVLNQLEHYSKISKIELKSFDGDSEKLGEICAKPFKILIIGIKNKNIIKK